MVDTSTMRSKRILTDISAKVEAIDGLVSSTGTPHLTTSFSRLASLDLDIWVHVN